jgi:predicted transcriptional regulator
VLDENDQELVEALEAVGVRRNVATIIVYLKDLDETTTRDIEKGSGLRQPEVSIAMRVLREKGWIAEREVKGGGKGRPMRLYKLTVPIDDLIGYYEEMKRNESSRAMQSIQKLKEISAT